MEAHHASLGRRKLEEIRQKKAAEKGSKFYGVNAAADSNPAGLAFGRETNNVDANWTQNHEGELQYLQSNLRKVQEELQEQQLRYADLSAELQTVATERNTLQQQLKNLEESKRMSLENLKMEKDAAVRAREDLVAQLRVVKKRLQEAEEEQYKAEEDAAALRAEIELLHRREERGNMILPSSTSEQLRSMEQEMATVKVELQDALHHVQQERRKLDAERERVASLTAEKEQLMHALNAAHQKEEEDRIASNSGQNLAGLSLSADISRDEASSSSFPTSSEKPKGKSKHEHQLRELASMVERLEKGRQKLLTEIDFQSLEIERLFVENASLATGLKESIESTNQWERQVQECLEQNAVLRADLNDLRMKQARVADLQHSKSLANLSDAERDGENINTISGVTEIGSIKNENSKLKVELAKVQGRGEALSAQVVQLSADLNRAMQNINSFNWIYKPVLTNIENQLLQLKQDGNYMEVLLQ